MQNVLTATTRKKKLRRSVVTRPPVDFFPWYVRAGQQPHVDERANGADEPDDQPYIYGWRYSTTTTIEGQVISERTPLTLEDLLHPQEEDHIMQRKAHNKNITHLDNTLGKRFENDSQAFVLTEMRMDLNIPGVNPLGPDVAVVFDVVNDREWGTFYTQNEGVLPSVVFEVTSPSTHKQDFGKKHEYYARAGVPFYVVLDIEYEADESQVREYRLHAYELVSGSYVDMQPNSQGHYWLPPLDVAVGLGEEGILCYDENGSLIENYSQAIDRAVSAEERADEQTEYAAEQERIAQEQTEYAAEQERIAQEQTEYAAEQERIAQQEAARSAEQGRIAEQERMLAQQEATRAAEQERIAQEQAKRADEQERIVKEQAERLAQSMQAQQAAADELARLRQLLAQKNGEA